MNEKEAQGRETGWWPDAGWITLQYSLFVVLSVLGGAFVITTWMMRYDFSFGAYLWFVPFGIYIFGVPVLIFMLIPGPLIWWLFMASCRLLGLGYRAAAVVSALPMAFLAATSLTFYPGWRHATADYYLSGEFLKNMGEFPSNMLLFFGTAGAIASLPVSALVFRK